MSICYIVGAGEFHDPHSELCPCEGDLVIAADGGYEALTSHGVGCDLLIGDLDSIGKLPEGIELQRHKVEKDETDMHLCYLEGARRGFDTFYLFGGVGARPDHTLANYALLLYMAERGHNGLLFDSGTVATVIKNGVIRLSGDARDTVSVFAFGGEARGVDISGLKYEAHGVTLTPDFPLGVSNSFVGDAASISVEDGALLVIAECPARNIEFQS